MRPGRNEVRTVQTILIGQNLHWRGRMSQSESIDSLMDFCQQNNRVCPMPNKWNQLYDMLPGRRREGLGFKPASPLILAAWYEATDLMKRDRLFEHLRWASDHRALDAVGRFLRSLAENDWHHLR
jgi:hypothetical protein